MKEPSGSPHRASYQRLFEDGLDRLWRSFFPRHGRAVELRYVGMEPGEPGFTEQECLAHGWTYQCPMWLTLQSVTRRDDETRSFLLGELPLLTTRDSLIIKGINRVPVGQLRLYPGVYFERGEDTRYDTRRGRRDHVPFWKATIRPLRGAFLCISISGQADEAVGRVEVGYKACSLRELLEKLSLIDRAQDVLGKDLLFRRLVRRKGAEQLTLEDQGRLLLHFFEPSEAYDLSSRGRERLNARLGERARQSDLTLGTNCYLTGDDVIATLAYLLGLAQEYEGCVADDLNHLQHRWLVLLGDQLERVLYEAIYGPSYGYRTIRQILDEGLQLRTDTTYLRYLFGQVRGVFRRAVEQCVQGQLCQVLDQTNPLAEVSHKRKVTFRGPGGVQSKYGSIVRRGVHGSHYGRLCLLETPESAHIGLNLYLAAYVQVNDEGQITAPYRVLADGTESVLTPEEEARAILGSPAIRPDAAGKVLARQGLDDVAVLSRDQVTHADLVPGQCLGLAASLVPFVQHDELNRAMMGAKNMKQAVPLLHPEQPQVKTGMEETVARLSGRTVLARRAGTVTAVSAERIVVACQEGDQDTYELAPYSPTSSVTCLYQRPLVRSGEDVTPGQVLADAAAIQDGGLALGVNLLVAYMPWYGYNFEDAIVISDRLQRTNLLTSLHVEEYSCEIRGNERVGLGKLVSGDLRARHLCGPGDPLEGVIREGARVEPGTVLCKKWRVLKGVDQGEPRYEYAPAWLRGTVVRVMRLAAGRGKAVASSPGADPEDPTLVKEVIKVWVLRECKIAVGDKLMGRHGNKGVVGNIVPEAEMPHLEDGTPVDVLLNPHGVVSRLNLGQLYETHLGWVAHVLGCTFTASPFERLRLERCHDQACKEQIERILAESATDREALEQLLDLANRHAAVRLEHGKARLIDGRTGKVLAAPVTMGYQYLLKLNHLVEDKIHAREEGDYGAWVEQPVKGRKRGGGQRLGEMEVWALEAYNTPELLREFLTYKSDDVITRRRVWEQVGKDWLPSYLPESVRVAVLLLRGVGLKLDVFKKGAQEPEDLIYGSKLNARDIERLRLSIATAEDIRGWGPQEVRDVRGPRWDKTVVWACACPGKKGLRGEEHKGKTCPQCQRQVQRWVLEAKQTYTQDGLFSQSIFGVAEKRRYAMARLTPAAPVVNPLFIGPLSDLLDQNIRPFIEWAQVWIPETDESLSWREYEARGSPQLHVLSGADYVLYRLDQLAAPPETWNPHDTILTVLPILPPDLRPLIVRPGDTIQFDLNRLYRRVLVANRQLASISQDPKTAAVDLVRKKKRLQLAVNALFVKGYDRRRHHYRSIGELLQGKEGILRQHLLGKRTDYSGRAVIVPGPELELDECGLPVAMAVGMFRRPLVEAFARARSLRKNVASVWIGHERPAEIEKLLAGRVVLLNRAPTLHRYNILAFHPRISREQALALPPLVCGGFNADFDGDTMAVHIPLLGESCQEALRCLPARHLLSIANGRLLLHVTQDIVAGIYWQTMTEAGRQEFNRLFDASGTVGLDPDKPVDKKTLVDYLTQYLCAYDEEQTAARAEVLMQWGFVAATAAGLTLSLWDIPWITRDRRRALLEKLLQEKGLSRAALEQRQQQAKTYEDLVDDWKQRVEEAIEKELEDKLRKQNPLAVMVLSGARGKPGDVSQLGGMRGLMEKLGGERFRAPVDANFLEGLSPLEYFVSSFGSRKTMVDKKLGPAQAGDLTRRLVEAAYPLLIEQEGVCNSREGIVLHEIDPVAGGKTVPLVDRLLGRVLADDIIENGNKVAHKGEVVASPEKARDIVDAVGNDGVKTRSPLTCTAAGGICQHCYGWDLSRRHLQQEAARFPEVGLPVGIIAGQSIGERGTQLTMRTFHTGGVKGEDITQGLPRVKRLVEGWLDDELTTKRLNDVLKEEGLDALSHCFLGLLHQVYGGDVDGRHFEVILRAMLTRQNGSWQLRGVTRAALEREGILAAASFQRTLEVLAQAAVEGREEWLTGYKERIMLGKAIR